MVNCCVPFCKSKHKTGSGISFHDFPVDPELCRKWVARVSRKNWAPRFEASGSRVCSLHFKPSDFREGVARRVLKPGVVPSIFPHYPKYMQPKEHKPRSTRAIEKRQNARSVKRGTESGKMDRHVSTPAKSTFGQNRGEYVVPTTADADSAASTPGIPAEVPSSLLLSDVRSLAGPGTAPPVTIKDERPEESMEEDDVRDTRPSGPPATVATTFDGQVFPSSVVSRTSVHQTVRSQGTTSSIITNRAACTAGQVSSTASMPRYVQQVSENLPNPLTTATSEQPSAPGTYVAVRKRVVPWNIPSGNERKTRLEVEVLLEQKKKLEAELKKVEAELKRVEAEERKVVTETLLMAAEMKKCEEERSKLRAEAEFFVQEKKRSEEETKKAAAVAEFHLAEKKKAAAQEEVFVEQKKTEIVRRKMLLFELKRMRQASARSRNSVENDDPPYGNVASR